MDLLTNGNQYLRPEYLTPLPTTLDAKKSPLALLAQTCSQIGADPPSTKGLLSSLTTSSSSRSSNGCGSSDASSENERSASASSATSTTNSKDKEKDRGGDGGGGGSGSGSNQGHGHSHSKKKSNNTTKKPSLSNNNKANAAQRTASATPTENSSARTTPTIRSRSNSTSEPTSDPKEKVEKVSPEKSPSPKIPSSPKSLPLHTPTKDKLNLSGPFPYFQLPPTTPLTSANIPPYLHSYARLKAAASEINPFSHLSSGCRDPFCTGCQLGAAGQHLSSLAAGSGAAKGPCPAGCISCDHHKLFPMFPSFPPFPLPPSLASLYSHHQQQQQSSGGIPYVCNWISGDTYCGKRFASSEELLQHLRSHTSLAQESSSGGTGSLSSVLGYGPPPASLSISRTYPTPPLSPLSSSRYHPYAKPSSTSSPYSSSSGPGGTPFPPTFSLGGPPPSFSALAAAAAAAAANNPLSPYYPYSIYGQRLGSNGLGHP